ncbi:hypothetical protein [Oceanobacter sp. 4_MG-2023]|uniref:hypothetical protein n=1 Tax=Oceanobacter sp. 4_MG-2023 TaxID=3062623 RepID=UPI0027331105|nr:hypothetical protein [Oceanobacter sp. 4_MG-2023]MDP2548872.1 hypothetical protein [Oceanobacter sp. 4_MG-2023]
MLANNNLTGDEMSIRFLFIFVFLYSSLVSADDNYKATLYRITDGFSIKKQPAVSVFFSHPSADFCHISFSPKALETMPKELDPTGLWVSTTFKKINPFISAQCYSDGNLFVFNQSLKSNSIVALLQRDPANRRANLMISLRLHKVFITDNPEEISVKTFVPLINSGFDKIWSKYNAPKNL